MKSSYDKKDVTILLKNITGLVIPQETKVRERLIQSGTHYCEMLPVEYRPSEGYLEAYQQALEHYSKATAQAVCQLAEKLYQDKGGQLIIVSLARAGIPIGILIKHYIFHKYDVEIPHYAISIIRGRGIDHNAIDFILSKHRAQDIQFVDGWIGKGAIQRELALTLKNYPLISSTLAVLSDPANITELCGTHEDILIPSSCLNCTVSGLVSRTFLREDIISKYDFHGAVYYKELEDQDVSYEFIHSIEQYFDYSTFVKQEIKGPTGMDEVIKIANKFGIKDINFIKPGIGEATRVLLRRVPWRLLIKKGLEKDSSLLHILRLAEEKNVPVEYYELKNYKACGIIRQMADT